MNYNLYKPDKASNYIQHFKPYIKSHPEVTGVVIYCRESTEKQRPNLESQLNKIKKHLRHFDVKILKIFSAVEKPWVNNDRPYLESAISTAKENNAVVVAYSVDRYIRYVCFSKDARNKVPINKILPMKKEYLGLNKISSGVVLSAALEAKMLVVLSMNNLVCSIACRESMLFCIGWAYRLLFPDPGIKRMIRKRCING